MKKIQLIISILIILIASEVNAQLSDLAKIDYTVLPSGNSNIEFNRIRAVFNYPIKLKKESTYLFLGVDYSNINLIMDDNPSFDKELFRDFQLLDLNIGYTTPLKNDWRLGLRLTPGFSSNVAANEVSINDIVISGDVIFIKDKKNAKKPWRLILGASYSGNRGFSFPLPFISYYKKFHSKWSYAVGVPKINLQHHFSNKHRLKLYAEIDGFTANLQRGALINNNLIAESINMSLILSGLQYEYHITKNLQFYARTAYVISNSVKLRDSNKDNILDLDSSNKLYLRTGVRFKI